MQTCLYEFITHFDYLRYEVKNSNVYSGYAPSYDISEYEREQAFWMIFEKTFYELIFTIRLWFAETKEGSRKNLNANRERRLATRR